MTARREHSGKADPRDLPIYAISQAARYLRLPQTTLRSWILGRRFPRLDGTGFSEPLIQKPDPSDERLSFTNLIEAHVLHALRVKHGIAMKAVREALDYAQREFHIDRLLVRQELRAAPGELFLSEYGRLLSLSPAGQFAMERVLEAYLERVARDTEGLPFRLYPFTSPDASKDQRVVAIDPRISFGRPVIARKGISTSILAERLNAGETVRELAYDYDLDEEEVAEAIIYERAA
ncbi:MAG TPA: DUF433 domain-containing protein [Thermoanaerobaculia bacterium]|jgi:uncharacterized protein (DUF433 family)|nr:DUF433 domain-containing protein [Thermoanaerobaculia bacterium]